MTNYKRENVQSLLFEDFSIMMKRIGRMSAIMQNRDVEITTEQLKEWETLFNKHIGELKSLKKAVIAFHK